MKGDFEHYNSDCATNEIDRIEQLIVSANFEKANEAISETIKRNPDSPDLLNR
jgi:hypothetical protein